MDVRIIGHTNIRIDDNSFSVLIRLYQKPTILFLIII